MTGKHSLEGLHLRLNADEAINPNEEVIRALITDEEATCPLAAIASRMGGKRCDTYYGA